MKLHWLPPQPFVPLEKFRCQDHADVLGLAIEVRHVISSRLICNLFNFAQDTMLPPDPKTRLSNEQALSLRS